MAVSKKSVVVVGGGHFGRLALQRLGARVVILVEPQPDAQLEAMVDALSIKLVREPGAAALSRILRANNPPDWVVPAIPRHLLMDWLLLELAGQNARRQEVPPGALPAESHLTQGTEDQVFLSFADFLCPDDCPEPAAKCTVTGAPREKPLFKLLAEIDFSGWRTGVVRSYQLAPGVGGCRTAELGALGQRIADLKGRWLIATACRCHGVMGGLSL